MKQIKRSNSGRKSATELQTIRNKYIVLATSLSNEISTEQILELYRMRWQIELVFKRFKSIFGGREFNARKEDAVKTWFYGKFLIAVICETIAKSGLFFPEEKYR